MIIRRKHVAQLGARWMPFADAASADLPLGQLWRLALFQISVGMAQVLLLGTLNRVMIVELSVPAMVVAMMIAIPVLVAPFRALLGHRSDTYRSALGWKRIPYLWFGSLWQMGGLAVMPFALIVLSGDQFKGPTWAGEVLAALAFLMAGLGMHMTQTAGLALAADRASDDTRPRVVAMLYILYLVGMGISAIIVGWLLRDYEPILLVRVVQGCGAATLVLNIIAFWKQERVRPMSAAERAAPRPAFAAAWKDLMAQDGARRLLVVVFIGTLAFNMQDVLLEPYGGQVLGLSVSATTLLTGVWALGALLGFIWATQRLSQGAEPYRQAARGLLFGIAAFSAVIFASPLDSAALFYAGAFAIGLGNGVFGLSTLNAAMAQAQRSAGAGLALGAWGSAQATAAGLAILIGGVLRDAVNHIVDSGLVGAVHDISLGYSVVYHIEIALLFLTLAVLGPLVRIGSLNPATPDQGQTRLRLAEFPT
ncbi:PucC family protein [Aliigemmobacter aestuarii]|uniref:PucC family protein n=1 Tax=Aliigemmobacter aestuarii TaxID=1445661 RepID=A0A4S3MVJ6_9RHOB|nr:PucC family protein [Gemmobacter aestuarii]THD85601.1 PucC family protein [Gemmobacter aestuarii]